MEILKKLLAVGTILSLVLCRPEFVHATASTHIWAPSTDTQAWGTGHVTADVYIPAERNMGGTQANTITNTGLTFGMLPFKIVQAEAGFDYKTGYSVLDNYPMYFNAKIAIPEDAFKGKIPYAGWLPAVAVGIYDVGTKKDKTDNNIFYVETAKTIKVKGFDIGRFSVGYFWGNDKLLLNPACDAGDADGLLFAYERTMTEISDKLWVCAEYQGSKSSYGAFNLGFSWQFTPSTSVLVGYEFYNNRNLADTATIQVDINF